jgi:hypothetical protein
MSSRLWYPQLDVYDAIRRIACLLLRWKARSLSPERLAILDFYLATPTLLHDVNMTQEARNEFQRLHITTATKQFLSYPSAPILFQKMEEIQKSAVRTLAGKDLILRERLANNEVVLSESGITLAEQRFNALMTEGERAVLQFLTETFGTIGLNDIRELRRRTGLRRAVQ